jgi:hypothetical protein
MKSSKIVIALLLAILFASCNSQIISGICIDKKYTPQTTVTEYKQYGHTSLRETSVKPEKWIIKIINSHHTKKITVTEEQYSSIQIGDTIRFSK